MSGNPERARARGGREGQPCSTETQIPDSMFPSFRCPSVPPWVRGGTPKSRFHVSKCADSKILLCKFQIPSFRVSKIPRPLCRSAEGTQFPNSLFPRGQIPGYSSANSRFQDSECADSWILLGKFQIPSFLVSEAPSRVPSPRVPKFQFPSFRVSEAPSSLLGPVWRVTQIPSFRVSEAPSWVRALKAQGTPKFQIPSFRVSEAPSIRTSSEQRDTHIPDSEFPSFRGLLLQGPSQRDPPQIPDSQFPSFRGPRLLGPRSTTNSVPDSECNTDLPCRARGITYVESKFQNTESSFYFRSCTHREPSGALAAPPAVTHLPRAPSFRRPPSSRRGEALWERVVGGGRVGFAGGGLF